MRIIFRIVSDVFSIDISTCMSLAQLFLFYILDTLKRVHFHFEFDMLQKVSLLIATKLPSLPRDKLKCLQLQLKCHLFSKICQISANLELFSMCMDVSVWNNHWFCVFTFDIMHWEKSEWFFFLRKMLMFFIKMS